MQKFKSSSVLGFPYRKLNACLCKTQFTTILMNFSLGIVVSKYPKGMLFFMKELEYRDFPI
jgi:hypothetical protein